jgi:spore maturation protein CgeB
MKILIVGSWMYPMYEKAMADAFIHLGNEVDAYSWKEYFSSVLGRAEIKFTFPGYNMIKFNNDLVKKVATYMPEMVLTWRATCIFPQTLKTMRELGVQYISSYNHDDFTGPSVGAPVPFHHHLHWRLFLKGAKYYDFHFVKRVSNIEHLQKLGSFKNYLMPMWFIPSIHRPVELTESEEKQNHCDIVFVGHYEADDRVNHLRALVKSGLIVKIHGGGYWTSKVLGDLFSYFMPILPAEGENYAKALCGAKVCLAFLSKLNRDTYTRRCFEIPACGRVMLAERTDDLLKMFIEDEEACFFSTTDELVRKAKWLVANPDLARNIAFAGQKRVWKDKHDINSRAADLLSLVIQK